MSKLQALINGEQAATLDPRDRGLAYGDGVFRTLRLVDGRLPYWSRHFAKLQADCQALGMHCPCESLWLADIAALAVKDAVIKLMVTRGIAARGYACDATTPPTRITLASPPPSYPEAMYREGVVTRLCDWRLTIQPGLAGIKHLNRLDQVMARREWQDANVFDGLMLNGRDELVEGVISNLFLVRDGVLYTHPLADCGVAGVMRGLLLEQAVSLGISVNVVPQTLAELIHADEVWLCNSLMGVVPVRQCFGPDNRFPISWHKYCLFQAMHDALLRLSETTGV